MQFPGIMFVVPAVFSGNYPREGKVAMATTRKKEIRDAVHGDIEFDKFEIDVINTPEFQRMRAIRQLGLGHLVYPGAHHTRFEHSLGVAHMASKIVQAARKNCGEKVITPNELRFVRVLALIHDIGHIPFGHTLEDERPVFDKVNHHDGEVRLRLFLENTDLAKALQALGKAIERPDLPKDLIRVMKRTHEGEGSAKITAREDLLAKIVGNTICADLLDYLRRDPYFTGIHHTYDEKFISAFEIRDEKIFLNLQDGNRVRHGVLSEILHLLRLRYTLGERVYYHMTKAAASAMISKAVGLSELPHEVLSRLRDEELLYLLENASPKEKVFGVAVKNPQAVASLIRSIRHRRLYIPVYTISRAAAGAEHKIEALVDRFFMPNHRMLRTKVEEQIAKLAGVKGHQVIVYCPDKKMSTKAAMVEVLWPKEETPRPLQDLCAEGQGIDDENTRMEIDQLKKKHEALWQLTVFVDTACTQQQCQDVAAHCEATEEFHQIRNQTAKFSISPRKTVRNRSFVRAIATLPDNRKLDDEAVKQFVTSDFYEGDATPTIDGIQKQISRPSSGEKAVPTQKDLFNERSRPGTKKG